MKQLTTGILFLLILSYIALVSCSQETSKSELRIGINPWPGYEFLYLAKEVGIYKELGVNVKIIEYGSLSDVRRGYERGNIDIMATTLIEVLQVKQFSERKPMIFLVADFSNGGDVIIAKKPLKNVISLKSKRIGADTTSLPIFVLARALQKSGLTLNDVTVVPLEQSEMQQAFNEGKVDAVVTYPPLSIKLLSRDDMQLIFTSKELPGEIVDVVSVESSILNNRKDDIKKIILAWDKALAYAKLNPDKAYTIMAKREGITAKEFSEALSDLNVITLAEQEKYFSGLKTTLNDVKNVLVHAGALDTSVSSDCCVIDFSSFMY